MTTEKYNYRNPVQIISGSDYLEEISKSISTGTWLLITSKGFGKRGVTDQIEERLKHNTSLIKYTEIQPNPELDLLDNITNRYQENKINGIISIGGGSVIDAGKILSLTLESSIKSPLRKIFLANETINFERKIPLIAIPTTSGTGAEVTPFSTLWDNNTHTKFSLTNELIYPNIAILDPKLTLSLPKDQTLYTGLDCISHALESIWNINRNSLSESQAYQALILAVEALPVVIKEPKNVEMRNKMQQASLIAGYAISQTKTAIAHSISYPLTSYYSVPHGLACSFTLQTILSSEIDKITRNKHKKFILNSTLELLEDLNIIDELKKYVTLEKLLQLTEFMNNKDRSSNFIFNQSTEEIIERIIQKYT